MALIGDFVGCCFDPVAGRMLVGGRMAGRYLAMLDDADTAIEIVGVDVDNGLNQPKWASEICAKI